MSRSRSATNRGFDFCERRVYAAPSVFPPRPARPTLCACVSTESGASADTTVRTDGMSNPLAATSVATRQCVSPLAKARRAALLLAWSMSPCNAAQRTPAARSRSAAVSAACFLDTNTNTSPSSTNDGTRRVNHSIRASSPSSTTSTVCATAASARGRSPRRQPPPRRRPRRDVRGETRGPRWHGGAERRCLPVGTRSAAQRTHLRVEPHVEHLIRLVQRQERRAVSRRPFLARHRSMSRPGVPTTRCDPARSSRICSVLSAPPSTATQRAPRVCPVFSPRRQSARRVREWARGRARADRTL